MTVTIKLLGDLSIERQYFKDENWNGTYGTGIKSKSGIATGIVEI
jgi:hypothetical protein